MAGEAVFFTGCYSQPLGDMAGNGEGICRVSLDLATGKMTLPVCVAPCINPSYLAWGPGKQVLYATSEVVRPDTPALQCFARPEEQDSPGQTWRELNSVAIPGECPCHISVDPSGKLLASAQYASGDITLFEITDNGKIGALRCAIQHTGHGPNKVRQEGPHAHYAGFHDDLLVTADLGLDAVQSYQIDYPEATVTEQPVARLQTNAGSGPRHIAVVENSAVGYVLCELIEEISQITLKAGSARVVNTLPAFSNTDNASGAAAAIRISPDHRHLYASGRNQSVIACFEIDGATGRLTATGEIQTQGTGPRDFSLSPDGEFLVVANQITNCLSSFKRNRESGLLEATGHTVQSGSPVCVLF